MTQGLQFSVLFSSAESTLSLDAMPANAGQQSPELEQQAARFRQLLDTEQADGQRRQLVAAPQSKADATVIQTQSVVINTQQQNADNTALPEAVNAQQALDTELNHVATEGDAAGELIVLIQRANLTSGQLQKKAAVSAEFQQLVPELPIDKAGPVEQELAGIDPVPVTQTDKDLTTTPYGREVAGTLQPVETADPTADRQPITTDSVQQSKNIPATNGVSSQPVNIDATVTPVVEQALVDDSELAQPQSGKVVAQKESSVTSLTSSNREITANSSSEKERRSTEPVTAAQAAVQSDAVARSAPNLADNSLTNQENKASRQISAQLSNGVGSFNNLKSETSPGENAEPRGAGQGNEQRSFQLARLDVLLANTATGQSSAQAESFQQQLARFDAAVASSAQLQRTTEKATTPELSARLKQLNLQQQDAAGQLRERVQLMVRQNIQVAEIRLDPAELGQMQIRINLQQEQASVQFIVQQQQAKELLEQQMPRLREMLQQQGIQLGEGQVQQQSRQQQGNGDGSQRQTQTANQPADGFSDDLPAASTVEVQHRERLVDYYA